jgi:hypothetical protein
MPRACFVPVSALGSIALITSDDKSSFGFSFIEIVPHPSPESGKIVSRGRR